MVLRSSTHRKQRKMRKFTVTLASKNYDVTVVETIEAYNLTSLSKKVNSLIGLTDLVVQTIVEA